MVSEFVNRLWYWTGSAREIIEESEKMNPDPKFHSHQETRIAADDLISDKEDLPEDQGRLYQHYLE